MTTVPPRSPAEEPSSNKSKPNVDAEEILRAKRQAQKRLVLHGSMSFLLGLLAGLPYTVVIFRDYGKDWSLSEKNWLANDLVGKAITGLFPVVTGTERAWRMAHLEGVLNGTLIIHSLHHHRFRIKTYTIHRHCCLAHRGVGACFGQSQCE